MASRMSPNCVGISVSKYIRKLASLILASILLVFVSSLGWSGSAHADAFGCFQGTGNPSSCPPNTDTSKSPLVASKCVNGINQDWHTTNQAVGGSNVTVLSIHGGNIETNTSQIGESLRSLYNWSSYEFNGHVITQDCKNLKASLNPGCAIGDTYCLLHITSTNFNDPTAENLVGLRPRAVSIHGCGSACSTNTICVGGRATTQITNFRNYVENYKGLVANIALNTFDVPAAKNSPNPPANPPCNLNLLAGDSTQNIVNRTSTGAGLQLEMSSNIRTGLANNSVQYDLLRGVVYGGVGRAMGELPVPLVTFEGSESYTVGGKTFTRYNLSVENRSEYPSELFNPAPNLPSCGLNTNSSRTWVDIYNASNNQYIYGFCGLSSPQLLDSIWFAVEQGQSPPDRVYVSLRDRQTNRTYRSNRVPILN